jgi:hypothetical protein
MSDLCIIPAGSGTEGYVELGGSGTGGAVFRKHILNLGPLHYDGRVYNLDDQWYTKLAKNFKNHVSMVQAPVADGRNKHTEDPLRNGGEVVGLERDGNKVYTVIDVRNPAVAEGLRNKTIMGASAMLSMDYEDSRTGQKVGPALLHHCFTNRPHVLDLEPYEEIVAATADSADMDFDDPVVLATEDPVPTKDELIAALKADHGIDVEALTAAASARTDTAALTAAIAEALGGTVSLSGESLDQSDVVGAIVELARKNETLEGSVKKLNRKDAERTVQGYVDDGRLLAKSKDRAVEMYLTDGLEGLDDFLAPADAPFIKMSASAGLTGDGDGAKQQEFDIDSEIERLGETAASLGGHTRRKK